MQPKAENINIIDHRSCVTPLKELKQVLTADPDEQIQIWVEGPSKEQVFQLIKEQKLGRTNLKSGGRDQLAPCATLIVWTVPCGRAEYQAVLEKSTPEKLILFAVDPEADDLSTFLQRLVGIVKGVITKQQSVSLIGLAAAMAQREPTVQLGLEWLEANGYIEMQYVPQDAVDLTVRMKLIEGGIPDSEKANWLTKQIQILLEESHAYRRYYQRVDALSI